MAESSFQQAVLLTLLPAVSDLPVRTRRIPEGSESRLQNTWCARAARAHKRVKIRCNPAGASEVCQSRPFECPQEPWSAVDKLFSHFPQPHKNKKSQKRSDRFPLIL